MVKFAKQIPTKAENEFALYMVRKFIIEQRDDLDIENVEE